MDQTKQGVSTNIVCECVQNIKFIFLVYSLYFYTHPHMTTFFHFLNGDILHMDVESKEKEDLTLTVATHLNIDHERVLITGLCLLDTESDSESYFVVVNPRPVVRLCLSAEENNMQLYIPKYRYIKNPTILRWILDHYCTPWSDTPHCLAMAQNPHEIVTTRLCEYIRDTCDAPDTCEPLLTSICSNPSDHIVDLLETVTGPNPTRAMIEAMCKNTNPRIIPLIRALCTSVSENICWDGLLRYLTDDSLKLYLEKSTCTTRMSMDARMSLLHGLEKYTSDSCDSFVYQFLESMESTFPSSFLYRMWSSSNNPKWIDKFVKSFSTSSTYLRGGLYVERLLENPLAAEWILDHLAELMAHPLYKRALCKNPDERVKKMVETDSLELTTYEKFCMMYMCPDMLVRID